MSMRSALQNSIVLASLVVAPCLASDAGNAQWLEAAKLFNSGNFGRALPALTNLESAYPRNPQIHYMIGMCQKNLGRATLAQKELQWVASYAQDPALKESANSALADLKNAAEAATKQKADAAAAAAVTASAALQAAAPKLLIPPSKNLVDDSVARTIESAAKKGWQPCTNGKCLNYSKNGWHKMSVAGHPDSDTWMTFDTKSYSQAHIGSLIDQSGQDNGPCFKCLGTGWVRK